MTEREENVKKLKKESSKGKELEKAKVRLGELAGRIQMVGRDLAEEEECEV